jgi:hypothetical protein
MQHIRCEIDSDLEEMGATARSMVDWKHYVKTYPWVCLGAAAALGFLLVPKRSTAIHPDLAALTELLATGHPAAEPAPAATRGWFDLLLAEACGMAVRKAMEFLGQSVAEFMGTAAAEPSRPPPANDGAADRAFRRN